MNDSRWLDGDGEGRRVGVYEGREEMVGFEGGILCTGLRKRSIILKIILFFFLDRKRACSRQRREWRPGMGEVDALIGTVDLYLLQIGS